MIAFLKLISNEESAKPTSLAKDFDLILEEEKVVKSFSLYKERRFSKLGYTAGALVDCIPLFQKLLEATHHNNMLVQACKLYLECEYIHAAWRTLAYFTYYVTMPFLNCIEKNDQNDLVQLLPNLHQELCEHKLDTLKYYGVKWTHVKFVENEPDNDLDKFILNRV